jgi:transposase
MIPQIRVSDRPLTRSHARILLKADRFENGLAWRDQQIATALEASVATVERVLHRFRKARTAALPPGASPSRPRAITPVWETERLRVFNLDLHTVSIARANRTMGTLAASLSATASVQVSGETVRVRLHAHDDVCKRPTWTLNRNLSVCR